jgi:hypothetical protein
MKIQTVLFVSVVLVWLSALTFFVFKSSRIPEPGAWYLANKTEIQFGPYKSHADCIKDFLGTLERKDKLNEQWKLTEAQKQMLEREAPTPVCRYFFNNGVAR